MNQSVVCQLCEACNNDSYRIFYQTRYSVAMILREPIKKGHVMILPKKHVTSLDQLSAVECKDLFEVFEYMNNIITAFTKTNCIIFKNNGALASQPHVHFHIIPTQKMMREMMYISEKTPIRDVKTKGELTVLSDELIAFMKKK